MKVSDCQGGWAVITGAADGIGRALADNFASQGLHLVLIDIRADALAGAAASLAREGVTIRTAVCDVSDRDAMIALGAQLAGEGVVPSILWINAGVASANSLIDAKPGVIEWIYGVNVLGSIWTAQAFVPAMKAAGGARHVGITASSASITPVSGPFTLYAASKQGTAAVGEALMAELAESGIGVTMLCPGILNTGIWNSGRARPERHGGARVLAEEHGAHWREQLGPDVLIDPVNANIAQGGGWCVVASTRDIRDRFDARVAGQQADWTEA
jgi:short-subunit dehydrogenase